MTSPSSLADAVTELAKTFTGQLLRPTDPGYEDVRKVHNGLVDKRPALITRCRGVADIVEAVNLASWRSRCGVAGTTWPAARRSTAA